MTRIPLARRGTKVAKAISLIKEGKGRKEVVEALGLRNDFTYYNALRKLRERAREYAANKSGNGQPETSGNPANQIPPTSKGGPLRYELSIIDHRGNKFEMKARHAKDLLPLVTLLATTGDEE